MTTTTPIPTPMRTERGLSRGFLPSKGHKSRRRQRSVPVPNIFLASIAPVFFAAIMLPRSTISWTAPIVNRKSLTSTISGNCFVGSHQKRSVWLDTTENSLDSNRLAFTSPLLSSTTALCSTKQTTELKSDNINGSNTVNGNDMGTSTLEISYGNNSTRTTLVETEKGDEDPKPAAKSKSLSLPTPMASTEIRDIVIVLNTNAKGVTGDLVEAATDLVEQQEIQRRFNNGSNDDAPRVHLHVTSTYDAAKNASKEIMATATANGGRTMVIPVGGDGTLTTMINLLWEEHRASTIKEHVSTEPLANSNEKSDFPVVFGYVAMGTGNALGSVVGCSPVAPDSKGKRKRIQQFVSKCLRPQKMKRKEFSRVLSQLIDAAAQTQPQTAGEETAKRGSRDKMQVDTVELPLIRVRTTRAGTNNANGILPDKDQYAFFAGVGYDSLLLQDYKDQQDWTETKSRLKRAALLQVATTGVVGYTVAMFTRSLPELLRLKDASKLLRDVKITTEDPGSAYWIDHRRGDTMRPAISTTADGTGTETNQEALVYRGSAGIVAAGTVPFYGGGLRLFPFARMTPGGMHFRIVRHTHPFEGISKIPWVFEGSFRDKTADGFKCLDFVGNQFTVEIYKSYKYGEDSSFESNETEEGFPVQHSGEAVGRCTRVEFTLPSSGTIEGNNASDPMPPPMRFITLMPPRLVDERFIEE